MRRKSLNALPRTIQKRIIEKLEGLESNPRPLGAKMLRGEPRWRVRVGAYRIIYEIRDNELLVIVVRIGHRRDVYD
ncbi:MAG: type II toxin-antitoxin system RelE/ParE family toxin [Deltaproteobacteria bacterium]|nr:type II toxin-antitoxin system RelE/ParE family toxin [Deltaproteobacteria bacterium]